MNFSSDSSNHGAAPVTRPLKARTSACSVFDPGLLPSEGGGCTGRVPPARVADADAPGDETYVVVLRDILIDQRGEPGDDPATAPWRDIGFNLDNLCTTATEAATECRPPSEGLPIQVDGNDGIDNTFGNSFFPVLSLGAAGIDTDLIMTQERGVGAVAGVVEDAEDRGAVHGPIEPSRDRV